MDIDIYNYKTYKHLSNLIYEILYRNREKYTVTNTYILCSYSKLTIKVKMRLINYSLLIITIVLVIIPSVVNIINLIFNISKYIISNIYYKYLTD